MKELLLEYLPYIITSCVGVGSALIATITAVLNAKKKKYEYQAALSQKDEALVKLELEKIKLEELMLDGSFIICPNCQTEIKAKDMVFYTKEKMNEKS